MRPVDRENKTKKRENGGKRSKRSKKRRVGGEANETVEGKPRFAGIMFTLVRIRDSALLIYLMKARRGPRVLAERTGSIDPTNRHIESKTLCYLIVQRSPFG